MLVSDVKRSTKNDRAAALWEMYRPETKAYVPCEPIPPWYERKQIDLFSKKSTNERRTTDSRNRTSE